MTLSPRTSKTLPYLSEAATSASFAVRTRYVVPDRGHGLFSPPLRWQNYEDGWVKLAPQACAGDDEAWSETLGWTRLRTEDGVLRFWVWSTDSCGF